MRVDFAFDARDSFPSDFDISWITSQPGGATARSMHPLLPVVGAGLTYHVPFEMKHLFLLGVLRNLEQNRVTTAWF